MSSQSRPAPCQRAPSAVPYDVIREIHPPLDGLLGLVELLRQTDLTPTQRRYVDTIGSSSSAMLGVVSRISELATLESGSLYLNCRPVSVEAIGFQALVNYRAAAEVKGLQLKSEFGTGTRSVRSGDGERIQEVIEHLLDNAVKYTQSGSITLSIQRIGHDRDGLFHFSVSDTGIGCCPAEMATHLGGQPSHMDGSLSEGPGLGLRLSHRLATLMGGRIVVSSVPGSGSRFTLQVPMGPDLSTPEGELEEPGAQLASLRVLLVEDNRAHSVVLGAVLTRHGCVVGTVGDGRQALASAATGAYDVILIDLNMPIMDGMQAARAIRQMGGEISKLPIIGVSAPLMRDEEAACLKAGVNDFILKPIQEPILVETLLRWVHPIGYAIVPADRPA